MLPTLAVMDCCFYSIRPLTWFVSILIAASPAPVLLAGLPGFNGNVEITRQPVLSLTQVRVDDLPLNMTISVGLKSAGQAITSAGVSLENRFGDTLGPQFLTLSSGTEIDGVWGGNLDLEEGLEPGTYTVSIFALTGFAGIAILDTESSLVINGDQEAVPISLEGLILDPPHLPRGSDPFEIGIEVRLLHEADALNEVGFQFRTSAGIPFGSTDLTLVSSGPSGTDWKGQLKLFPFLLETWAPDGVLSAQLTVLDIHGVEQVLDLGIQYRIEEEGVRVRFQVDLSNALDLEWFKPALFPGAGEGMGLVVRIVSGPNQGAVELQPGLTPFIWTGSVRVQPNQALSWFPLIDLNGDGVDAGDWLAGDRGLDRPFDLLVGSTDPDPVTESFTNDRNHEFQEEPWALEGRFMAVDSRTYESFHEASDDTYWDIALVESGSGRFVTLARHNPDWMEGPLPEGISSLLKGMVWEWTVSNPQSPAEISGKLSLEAIPGIVEPKDLRFLVSDSFDSGWSVLTPVYSPVDRTLQIDWNPAHRWIALASVSAVNPFVGDLPTIPEPPFPGDGSLTMDPKGILSWGQGGADRWDVYLWKQGDEVPDFPEEAGLDQARFELESLGSIEPGTPYLWKVIAYNASGFVEGPVWSFTTVALPDFTIENIRAVQSLLPGQILRLDWEVRNLGGPWAPTASGIQQRLILSPSTLPEEGVLIAQTAYEGGAVPSGASTRVSGEWAIPRMMPGNYNLIIQFDSENWIGEANESNNFALLPVVLEPGFHPDIELARVSIPSITSAGKDIEIQVDVENKGTVSTPGQVWFIHLHLSRSATFSNLPEELVRVLPVLDPIPSGSRTTAFTRIWLDPSMQGEFFIHAEADPEDALLDPKNSNNRASSGPIRILASPPADLEPDALTFAPAAVESGGWIRLDWTVSNRGPGDVFYGGWLDAVYLSQDKVLDPKSDILLISEPVWRAPVAQAGYNRSVQVKIPEGLEGDWNLLLSVDDGNALDEMVFEGNNLLVAPETLSVTPGSYPDLVVDSVHFPDTLAEGEMVRIQWTVRNVGTGPANPSWDETVFYSKAHRVPEEARANGDWVPVTRWPARLSIAAGEAKVRHLSFPVDAAYADGGHFFVVVDDANRVYEMEGNQGNTSQALTFAYQAHPGSDLEATWSVPAVFKPEDRILELQWTVRNLGAKTLSDKWVDGVYLSLDDRLDQTGDWLLAQFPRTGGLDAQEMVNLTHTIGLPAAWSQPFYVIIASDIGNRVRDTNRTNNVAVSSSRIEVETKSLPQLRVDSAAFEWSEGGARLDLDWTIRNEGGAVWEGEDWVDTWMVSRDPVADPFDFVLHSSAQGGGLASGSHRATKVSVAFPPIFSGEVYILLVTDYRNALHPAGLQRRRTWAGRLEIPSGSETDLALVNLNAAPIRLEPGMDLVISGGIRNLGLTEVRSMVSGVVYLSRDPIGARRERVLGRVDQLLDLPPKGETPLQDFLGNLDWTMAMPLVDPGDWHLFVLLETGFWLNDSNPSNNLVRFPEPLHLMVSELLPGLEQSISLASNRNRLFHWFQPDGADSLQVEIQTPPGVGLIQASLFLDSPSSQLNLLDAHVGPVGETITLRIEPVESADYFLQIRLDVDSGQNNPSVEARVRFDALSFGISGVQPKSGGNGGDVTVKIEGAAFRPPMQVRLRNGENQVSADRVRPSADGVLYATFDLHGVPEGKYDLEVVRASHDYGVEWVEDEFRFYSEERERAATLPDAFEVQASLILEPQYRLEIPDVIGPDQEFIVRLEAFNPGNQDIRAPLVWLFGEPGFWKRTEDGGGYQAGSMLLLLTAEDGPGGVLRPGSRTAHRIMGRFVAPPVPGRELVVGLAPVERSGIAFELDDWLLWDPRAEAVESAVRDSLSKEIVNWSDFHRLIAEQVNNFYQGRLVMRSALRAGDLLNSVYSDRLNIALNPIPAGLESDAERSGQSGRVDSFNRIRLSGVETRLDTDGDGISDEVEREAGLNPEQADTDRDGISDLDEINHGLDPKNRSDGNADPDGDGLSNFDEIRSGSDPNHRDSDGNGESDLIDFCSPLKILKNENLLAAAATGFQATSRRVDSMAATHLRHFIDGVGTDITYGPNSRAVSDMRLHTSARNNYNTPKQQATLAANDHMTKTLQAIDWRNPPDTLPPISMNTLLKNRLGRNYNAMMKPDFYITEASDYGASHAFDLALGIGGTQKVDTRLEIERFYLVREPTCKSGGLAGWAGRLKFKFSDFYEFDKQDAGIGRMDAAGRDLQVCGVAKPYWVHIHSEELIRGQVVLPPLQGEVCEPEDEPKPKKPWEFPFDIADVPASMDPNDLLGPEGVGDAKFVSGRSELIYRIRFENDPELATAPAQVVRIHLPIDEHLDIRSLRFGDIGVGSRFWDYGLGRNRLDQVVDWSSESNLDLRLFAALDIPNRTAIWQLESLDKQTGRIPLNPLTGFLPVNHAGNQGEGYVEFRILPDPRASTGDRIEAEAEIVFDRNPAILTPRLFNTLDVGPPVTRFTVDGETHPGVIHLEWTGQDEANGSGIEDFDVLMSRNHGPWEPVLQSTTQTSVSIPVNPLENPRFQVVGRDRVGNVEERMESRIQAPYENPQGGPFRQWIARFLPEKDRGFGMDPDGDGRENGIEFFQGTNPGRADSGRDYQWNVIGGDSGSAAELVMVRATEAGGLPLFFESADRLGHWVREQPESISLEPHPGPGLEQVRVRFSSRSESTWFLRIGIQEP